MSLFENQIEYHPLLPFLPEKAQLLMLGSFPPPRKRWCMDFFYPNLINDMWRIMGQVFFDNRMHFLSDNKKTFVQERIELFLRQKGIALYDTATAVRRLKDNASDKYLEVVVPTDVKALLNEIPNCKAIATTGQKATDTLQQLFDFEQPPIGGMTVFKWQDREISFFRMPSSSRAYPLPLEQKAEVYRSMFSSLGMIDR